MARVLIRHPTSSSGLEGAVGQGGCPFGSQLLPVRRVTSLSFMLGSPSPVRVPQQPNRGSLREHSVPYVPPPDRGPPLAALAGHPQGPCEIGIGSSPPGKDY